MQQWPNDSTGYMSIMGSEGDTKFFWDKNNIRQVQAAQEIFEAHRGKGFLAFSLNLKGDRGDQMNEFDPSAESILFIPQMQGG